MTIGCIWLDNTSNKIYQWIDIANKKIVQGDEVLIVYHVEPLLLTSDMYFDQEVSWTVDNCLYQRRHPNKKGLYVLNTNYGIFYLDPDDSLRKLVL